MKPSLFIAFWLLFNVFAVGVYDVFAFFFLQPNESVSFWLQRWMQDFPVLALLLGVVIGHLCWPISRAAREAVERGN